MKPKFVLVANSLAAVGLLAVAGLISPAAAIANAAPAAAISGDWYFVYGARYDEQVLKESFYTGPSNQPHFEQAADAPVFGHMSENRSDGGQPQVGWLLPALQSCSGGVSALAGGGSKD